MQNATESYTRAVPVGIGQIFENLVIVQYSGSCLEELVLLSLDKNIVLRRWSRAYTVAQSIQCTHNYRGHMGAGGDGATDNDPLT